jgi:predicted Zn-dependent peptidase
MTSTFQKTVLPSGLVVLSERMPDRHSVSVGAWLRNGARDEPAEWLGISHFIEHMMFKGTTGRDARAIAQSLESVGGHLDAFTGREQVCYYARALSQHLPRVVDVLADITCRSLMREPELSRERNVVREEIFAAEDNPDDKVSEMLAGLVWGRHSLGQPILGTVETLDRLDPAALRQYFSSRYRPEQMVVAGSGGLEHGGLVQLVEKYFEPPAGAAMPMSTDPPEYAPVIQHDTRDDLQQLYLSLATRGAPYGSEDRYRLAVLNTLLGGGMSSRLFQSVREEAGLAYSVFSAADFHRDAGMLSVHLGVAPDKGREALALVRQELELLCSRGPEKTEVQDAKAQLEGSILMGQESVSNRMFHIAHEEIYCGRFTTPEEQATRIAAVTPEQVADAARRYLAPGRFTLAALGPSSAERLNESAWAVERAA